MYEHQRRAVSKTGAPDRSMNITYPFTLVPGGFKLPVFRFVFDVQLKEQTVSDDFTNIGRASVLLLFYEYHLSNASTIAAINEWEAALFDRVGERRFSDHLHVYLFGTEYASSVVSEGGFGSAPYVVAGCLLMTLFVQLTVTLTSYIHGQMSPCKVCDPVYLANHCSFSLRAP